MEIRLLLFCICRDFKRYCYPFDTIIYFVIKRKNENLYHTNNTYGLHQLYIQFLWNWCSLKLNVYMKVFIYWYSVISLLSNKYSNISKIITYLMRSFCLSFLRIEFLWSWWNLDALVRWCLCCLYWNGFCNCRGSEYPELMYPDCIFVMDLLFR